MIFVDSSQDRPLKVTLHCVLQYLAAWLARVRFIESPSQGVSAVQASFHRRLLHHGDLWGRLGRVSKSA